MKYYRVKPLLSRLGLSAALVLSSALASIGMTAAASASTLGEACLFSAPYGVIGTGTIGHIGYGYRNGTGNNWTFGATEGTLAALPGPPSTTRSWHLTGTWAQMLRTFGAGQQPNGWASGSGFYIDYRCTMVTSSNPGAAFAQVQAAEISGYNLITDNCLTKSVAILQQYGVPNLPGAIGVVPNDYFNSLLPSYPTYNPGFNSPQWLTTLTVSVKLVDPTNNSYLTTTPLHTTRPMHVQIYNASNQLVFDSDPSWNSTTNHYHSAIQAKVVPGTDEYQATFQLPGNNPNLFSPSGCLTPPSCNPNVWSPSNSAGAYLVKVQLNFTLVKQAPGIVLINQGVANNNSVPATNLIVGDINQDNVVNILDYNLLLACYSDLQPPPGPCPTWQKVATDLNDDGYVNGIDYNIMLRILQNQGGG